MSCPFPTPLGWTWGIGPCALRGAQFGTMKIGMLPAQLMLDFWKPFTMTPPKVLRYVNDKDGCRAELEGGQRIELSKEQWLQAIVKHFRPSQQAKDPIQAPIVEGPIYTNILDSEE